MDRAAHDPTAPGTSSPTSTSAPDHGATDDQSPAEAFRDLSTRFAELGEYVSYLLSAKVDGIKVSLRNAGIYAALGVLGLLAGGALIVTTVVLLLRGIAGGLGALFGQRLWLGEIVTAVLFLAILGVGTWFGLNRMTKASRERTVKKYASRQQQQRARFGTDVHERSASPARVDEGGDV